MTIRRLRRLNQILGQKKPWGGNLPAPRPESIAALLLRARLHEG